MKVMLHNPNSGELKAVKVGSSWTLFFFSGFFGLPLFLRKLYGWGIFFLIQPLLFGFVPEAPEDKEEAAATLLLLAISILIQLGFNVFIAIKGNEMTAKNLLEKGWRFAHPEAVETQFAKRKWKLIDVAPPGQSRLKSALQGEPRAVSGRPTAARCRPCPRPGSSA